MTRSFSQLREVLRDVVGQSLDDGEPALLLSGGTDSLTILWTLLDLGERPRCYTFRLASHESQDARASALAAKVWGVPHEIVAVPDAHAGDLAREVGQVVRLIGSSRKTHVECMWPLWHVARHVREGAVFAGLQADTLYGTSRSWAIKHARDPAGFLAARQRAVLDPDQEGLRQLGRILGDRLRAPYAHPAVRDLLMAFSWAELNRPRQKMPARVAFADRYRQAPIWRRNENLQCESGVREHLGALLWDPAANLWGCRSAAALYRRLGEQA